MFRGIVACLGLVIACGGSATVGQQGGSDGTGASGAGTTSGSAGNAGSGAGGTCTGCMSGFLCCDGVCVNPNNDISNCGDCGVVCTADPGGSPYCDAGNCGDPPCAPNVLCGPGSTCCDQLCCNAGEICCTIPGPVGSSTQCVVPDDTGTCPPGCTDCKCAAPDTLVATPSGERPIAELVPGDLVYSIGHDAIVAVPLRRVSRTPVREDHELMVVALADGSRLRMSPGHPTADRRTFAMLAPGDRLDGVSVVSAEREPYPHGATFDILPDSPTGVYFAHGVAVGSTLFGQ